MDFTTQRAATSRDFKRYPVVILRRDRWNDYGYVTMFHPTLYLGDGRAVELDVVKILRRGQPADTSPSPVPRSFENLPVDFCSLGQSTTYYEQLHELGADVYDPYLRALRDIAYLPDVEEAFQDEEGLNTSVLRFGTALNALTEGRALFAEPARSAVRGALAFSYRLSTGGPTATFSFGDKAPLPARLMAVIGYNGAGKTRLLGNLAILASRDRRGEAPPDEADYGTFTGEPPTVGAVIAVSYSAFDEFVIPGQGATAEAQLDRERMNHGEESARRYTYLGLRQVGKKGEVLRALKGPEALAAEYLEARRIVGRRDREKSLSEALEPLLTEPSFRTLGVLPDQLASDAEWLDAYRWLSSGHKIALSIVTRLCAHLDRRALVLIDEPEMHLHPPLLAALLKAVGRLLERHDSFAVIATHSPVVVQEVPAHYVKILRRHGEQMTIDEPEIETYAESVGLLTTQVFNLDSRGTDYQGTLTELVARLGPAAVEQLFEGRMSSQARAIVMTRARPTQG